MASTDALDQDVRLAADPDDIDVDRPLPMIPEVLQRPRGSSVGEALRALPPASTLDAMWDRIAAAEAADEWMRRYLRAWETNDPDDVRSLFTEDAEYRDGPSTPPWVGHDAIVSGWLGQQDEPGSWSFEHELTAVDGDVAVVRGRTHYPAGTAKSRRYDNLMVIRLDGDGRARSFTDWWVASDADEE